VVLQPKRKITLGGRKETHEGGVVLKAIRVKRMPGRSRAIN